MANKLASDKLCAAEAMKMLNVASTLVAFQSIGGDKIVASTIGLAGRAVKPDEAVLNGMKRSWFSLHFNTRRVRRWILVQLVSVPVQTEGEHETASARPVHFRRSQLTMARLLDDYIAAQFARRWA